MGRPRGESADARGAGRAHRVHRSLSSRLSRARAGGALAAAGLALAAGACGGDETTRPALAGVQPVPLQALPAPARALCQSRALLRDACPRVVPRARPYRARIIPRAGLGYETLDVHVSWPHGDPRRNRPPRFVHLVIEGGDVDAALEFPRSPAAGAVGPRTLRRLRSSALVFGPRRWGGRTGTLLLAPSFERSSTIHGDHLVFVWRERGAGRLVSLHAWEPLDQAVATLRAIVETVPRG